MNTSNIQIIPISHASLVLRWGECVMYFDPTGGVGAFTGQPMPNIVFVTDIHHDHHEPETIRDILGAAELIVPKAVRDELPEEITSRAHVLANGEKVDIQGFRVEATPMYNVPETPETFHPKGRGNGYVVEKDGTRVYVAGDTSSTPEMRALRNIDIAFLPMNLPYTMSIEEAAKATLAFKPKTVYPYHYRGPAGLSDVNVFKALINAGNPAIEVVLANWYGDRV